MNLSASFVGRATFGLRRFFSTVNNVFYVISGFSNQNWLSALVLTTHIVSVFYMKCEVMHIHL
jgi:hypothetical protein